MMKSISLGDDSQTDNMLHRSSRKVCTLATYGAEGVLRGACDQALAHHVPGPWLPLLAPLVGKHCRRACLQ